nr:reverse transcriptase domain-containing protein [Tanacetum cinerariifolium]
MRTRRSYFPPSNSIPRNSRRKSTSFVESDIQTNATIADNRTMAQMLQAPIEGYEDAIVVPPINANNFELKQTLINLVQSNQFTGRQDPHNHLRFFNKCKLLAVGSLFFWQWDHPPLAVGTYTASGNSLLVVGMPCAFYFQQSSPKLDAPSTLKFSR